jgi:cytochrome c
MSERTRRTLPGRIPWLLILACTAALGAAPRAHAADADQGAKVFKTQCAECHSTMEGKNKTGPSLFGVVGRNAGSVPGYRYSDAMKNSKLVWTDEELDTYLSDPRKVVPGCKMKYRGLTDSAERADVIAFLSTTR